jgi:sugar phosphate isomerase/epimerase
MTADRSLRIGVVLEAFLDWPLDRVMPWLREHAPDVTDLEIGAGGYAPRPHCDVPALLASDQARAAWRDEIARHGLRIDALNAWGNPLHPDAGLAGEHDRALRDRVAALGASLAANLDPSHFFWMGMDGHKVAAALGDRAGHVHGKDTVFHEEQLSLNGLLDRRWPEPAAEMPWTFAVPGRGYSAAEGQAMVAAAEAAGVLLMVGYPKRYDPAFTRMREETAGLEGARLLRVTTLESPLRPHVGHYPLLPRVPLPAAVAADLRKDSEARIERHNREFLAARGL